MPLGIDVCVVRRGETAIVEPVGASVIIEGLAGASLRRSPDDVVA